MDPTGGYDAYEFTAEFYDAVVPYRDRDDLDFYVDLAREADGPTLELGCGTGRVLIPTARAGCAIVGLDLAGRMLARCRTKVAAEPADVRARIELVAADMRDFALERKFALITIPFRPFQHLLTVEDQLACLRSARKHLAPGGRLVLDLFNPSLQILAAETTAEEYGGEPDFAMPDGRHVQRKFRVVKRDPHNQVNSVELIYYVTHPGGRTERLVHAFPMRYLFRYEVEHLLTRAGFTVEALYADYDRTPFGEKYPGELIFVARRD